MRPLWSPESYPTCTTACLYEGQFLLFAICTGLAGDLFFLNQEWGRSIPIQRIVDLARRYTWPLLWQIVTSSSSVRALFKKERGLSRQNTFLHLWDHRSIQLAGIQLCWYHWHHCWWLAGFSTLFPLPHSEITQNPIRNSHGIEGRSPVGLVHSLLWALCTCRRSSVIELASLFAAGAEKNGLL